MLIRVHFPYQWFSLADEAALDALHDSPPPPDPRLHRTWQDQSPVARSQLTPVNGYLHDIPVYKAFAGIGPGTNGIPDASAVLRFRQVLERHALATALLATVPETRGQMVSQGTRDPEMHQTRREPTGSSA